VPGLPWKDRPSREAGERVQHGSVLTRLLASRWRRLALTAFAVPAILIGLLTMHTMATTGGTGAHTAAVTAVHGSEVHGSGVADPPGMSTGMLLPVDDCGGPCGLSHDAIGMICVLALLGTVVLVSLFFIRVRWEELRRAFPPLVARAASPAPPAPPSLHVLSISRT
jgi:hypothetical protein